MEGGDCAMAARAESDHWAVMNLQALYGKTIDALVSRQGELAASVLREIFLDDAVIDFPGLMGRFEGIHAIEGGLFSTALPAQLTWMSHSSGSPMIKIDGDAATARWTLHSLAVSHGDGNRSEAVFCRYANSYRRTGRGWRQSSLLFVNETQAQTLSSLGAAVRTRLNQAHSPSVASSRT